MGKTKARRFRQHLTPAKLRSDQTTNTYGVSKEQTDLNDLSPGRNPFAGMKIDLSKLNTNLPPPQDWDQKTIVSIAKSATKGKNKRQKLLVKKQLLLKKLEAIDAAEKADKERKKREKMPIVKDLKPLMDALPNIDMIFHQPSNATKNAAESENKTSISSNRMTFKRRKREMMQNFTALQKVLSDEKFKANPTEVVLNHVRNLVRTENANAPPVTKAKKSTEKKPKKSTKNKLKKKVSFAPAKHKFQKSKLIKNKRK